MATLHLMVGLPCSGKTTLARRLEQEPLALRLTPDEWQIPLFGQDAEDPEHDARHSLIEAMTACPQEFAAVPAKLSYFRGRDEALDRFLSKADPR